MTTSDYLFLQSAEDLAEGLHSKSSRLSAHLHSSQIIIRARRLYNYYFNRYFRGLDNNKLVAIGEQGEFTGMSINHFRNIIKHLLSILTTNRLQFDCQAESTDVAARDATIIGNEYLNQIFYDRRIDKQIFAAVELGLVMGTSFVSVEWDPFVKLIGQDGEGNPVYSGQPKVAYHSIYDVIMDPFQDNSEKQQWMCLREIVNKWDLIALYPDKAEEIKNLPPIADLQWYDPLYSPEEDHVFIYKAYHKETPSLPSGRMTYFCEGGVILIDSKNPYVNPKAPTPNGGMPIFIFKPDNYPGSAYGYSISMDIAALQEALNILDSAIITNQDNYAVQNIIVPRESSISQGDLAGGSRLIEYSVVPDVPNGGKPEILQLCATPSEVFSYRKELIQQFEVLSGVNAVLRGQPQASLISGTALALVATQANTFNSTLEANYVRLNEDIAHFVLYITARFQTTEELVSLMGKGKSNEIRSFKGNDLNPIRQVKVIVGNALASTTAGKIEIAEMLTKNGVLKTPAAVIEAIRTGNITQELENETAEPSFIKYENEALLRGEDIPVIGTDTHPLHILEHRTLLFKPDVRQDQAKLQIIFKHMQAHMDNFDEMSMNNPTLLNLIMGSPMPLPAPNPATGIGPGASAPPPQQIGAMGNQMSQMAGGGKPPAGMEQVANQAYQSAANKLNEAKGQ